MAFHVKNILKDFYVIGVNHYRTGVSIRELFSLNTEQQQQLLDDAKSLGLDSLVVLSTCNRTEIYTQTDNLNLVKRLFTKHSQGSLALLEEYAYQYSGADAIQHLYKVGAGLDSQILGDFQIIGQLKNAYRLAEQSKMVNTLLNRVFSHVFQASKKVKNQTGLSNGTASVAHAAVQYIKDNVSNLENCNLLLYGTGDIGKITCDNLVRHMQNKHALTLINRSEDKAAFLAKKYQVSHKTVSELSQEFYKADIIIVATGANTPTITTSHLKEISHNKLILDLSVPRNVASEVANLSNIQLVDVDELSQVSSETLKIREESVPKAKHIIAENYEELKDWLETQQLSPIFKGLQQGLTQMKEQELAYHRAKLSDEEYEKADLIATNIVNRISRMGISHIKDVFKSSESSAEMLSKMFGQYANEHPKMPKGCPHYYGKYPHSKK